MKDGHTYEHHPLCDDDGWDHFGPCILDDPADLEEPVSVFCESAGT